jgi:hypothetical protein
MIELNLWTAWSGILAGMMAGAVQGLFFDREGWLGGYASWPCRLSRLGHVSFFGLGFVNLAFVYTADRAGIAAIPLPGSLALSSLLLAAGAVLMPLTCYLSAWRFGLRRMFVLPVAMVIFGVASLLVWGVSR